MTEAPRPVPAWSNGWATLYEGDCRAVLAAMPAASAHVCICSPPYWGSVRDYHIAPVMWADGWSGCLGNEPDPEAYIAHLVEVFRAVRRVLRDDATLWLNLGDCYAGGGSGQQGNSTLGSTLHGAKPSDGLWGSVANHRNPAKIGLKPLDLANIPHRVAEALRQDGWHWRSTVVWEKTGAMPESIQSWRWEPHRVKVKRSARAEANSYHSAAYGDKPQGARDGRDFADHSTEWKLCPGCATCAPHGGLALRKGSWRPTSSHEFVFMLTPTATYFGDGPAVQVPHSPDGRKDTLFHGAPSYEGVRDDLTEDHERWPGTGRNLRDVWRLNAQPLGAVMLDGAKVRHHASYPEDLVRPCILASTPEYGCCAECGAAYARVMEYGEVVRDDGRELKLTTFVARDNLAAWSRPGGKGETVIQSAHRESRTLGWKATCEHDAPVVPATVLDCFAGTGTTLVVAQQLGRRSVGIEMSETYIQLARKRLEGVALPMVGV